MPRHHYWQAAKRPVGHPDHNLPVRHMSQREQGATGAQGQVLEKGLFDGLIGVKDIERRIEEGRLGLSEVAQAIAEEENSTLGLGTG